RGNLRISSGKYARFTDGCAVAEQGDTSVMVTAVSKPKPTPSSFLPLVVDYRQKAAAAGRIPTNFLRRELGPSEHEILVSRVIDRSLRPLFPAGFNYETQLVVNLLAVDGIHDPEILSINAASAALCLSDIPWNGPIGAVRVGLIDNEVVINPSRKELTNSDLNLIVVATSQSLVVMLEGFCNNILQQYFLKAIKSGVKECQKIVQSIQKLQKECGKVKRTFEARVQPEQELLDAVKTMSSMKLKDIFTDFSLDKTSRDEKVREVRTDLLEKLKSGMEVAPSQEEIGEAFVVVCKDIFRELVFETKL
ncbi:hypothetical protein LSTR_LSTR017423, partial [Laodelphax striatellus]